LPQPQLDHPFGASWLILLVAEIIVFAPFLAYAILANPSAAQKT
jgi:hypothetical protein